MENAERDAMAAVIVAAITGKPNNEACVLLVQMAEQKVRRDRAYLDDMRRG
jgi:mannose-1-phosphate guanylyltransferase